MPTNVPLPVGAADLASLPDERCCANNCAGQQKRHNCGQRYEFADEVGGNGRDGEGEGQAPEDALDERALAEVVKIGEPGRDVPCADGCGDEGGNRQRALQDLLCGDVGDAENLDLLFGQIMSSRGSWVKRP